jgi:hypothetical protein
MIISIYIYLESIGCMADDASGPWSKSLATPSIGRAAAFLTIILSVIASLITLLAMPAPLFISLPTKAAPSLQRTVGSLLTPPKLVDRTLNQLVNQRVRAHPALLTVCQLTDITLSAAPSLEEIIQKTQRHWLRKPGLERHELIDSSYEAKRYLLLPLLQPLKVLDKVEAKQIYNPYDVVLIHGAMADAVKIRIQFLMTEYQRGVRFNQVVLLSGDRPLHTEKESEYLQLGLTTEAEMMQHLWETMPGLTDSIKQHVHLVVAKGKIVNGKYKRPNTRDTVYQWLNELAPKLGDRYLAVSHQPFVPFQDFVLYNTLTEKLKHISLETIGPQASLDERVAVHLDNLARCLYELQLSCNL